MNETKQENNNVEKLNSIDLQTVMLILIKKVEELDKKVSVLDEVLSTIVKNNR